MRGMISNMVVLVFFISNNVPPWPGADVPNTTEHVNSPIATSGARAYPYQVIAAAPYPDVPSGCPNWNAALKSDAPLVRMRCWRVRAAIRRLKS